MLSNASKYRTGDLRSSLKGLPRQGDTSYNNLFPKVESIFVDYIDALITRLQKSLKDKGKDVESPVSQSIDPLPIVLKDNIYTIELKYSEGGKWFDSGRGAGGMPPFKKIYDWVRYNPDVYNLAKNKPAKTTLESSVKSLTWAIMTNIAKKGTVKRFGYKGSNWLTEIIGEQGEILETEMTLAISLALKIDVEVHVTKQVQKAFDNKLE